MVRNINRESFIYIHSDYNYKISKIWFCFLHICSWGICYFYIDKLLPNSPICHSSHLFSNWILNFPREFSNSMIPSEEELPATTMTSPKPIPIDNMPTVDVGIGHLWMEVLLWNHLSSNSRTFDSAIHLSQIFLGKHRPQIFVSKKWQSSTMSFFRHFDKMRNFSSSSSFIARSKHFPNQSFYDCLKNEQVESVPVKEWKNGKPEQMSLPRL